VIPPSRRNATHVRAKTTTSDARRGANPIRMSVQERRASHAAPPVRPKAEFDPCRLARQVKQFGG